MTHLLPTAVLLAMFVSKDSDWPAAFYKIPEPTRETATVIVSGTYAHVITLCIPTSDGARAWGIDSWFNIKRVYRGKVVSRSIKINTAMLPKTRYVTRQFERGREYLVLLRPDKETMEKFKTKDGNSFWDGLHDEEIVAIVESKE